MRPCLLALLLGCPSGDPPADSVGAGGAGGIDTGTCSADDQGELYARYVEPVVTDAASSSCNACHLAGVDLSMFVQGTPCESMACMLESGLVDFDDPASSTVLAYITQGEAASDLITDSVRQREYDGFLQWIEWSATCQDEVCGDITDPCANPGTGELPESIATPLGGCDEATLATRFETEVYVWKGRCESCHAVDGAGRADNAGAPLFVARSGDGRDNLYTMYNLIGLGAINMEDPAASTLMTKPLQEGASVETDLGTVTGIAHGGGDKIHVEDGQAEQTLYDFADWIGFYVGCLGE